MRGADEQPGSMFSYVSLEDRVAADHPLRAIRRITDRALERLSPRFGALYIHFGRPSIPPEKLLRALLLQALYTIRSERQLMEQLDYNLLFRWFVGLGMDDPVVAVDLLEESGPAVGRRHSGRVLRCDPDPCGDGAAAVRRAFHRRWDAAGVVGQSEEFPPTGRGPAFARGRDAAGEFPWATTPQCDAPVDHGSRCPVV